MFAFCSTKHSWIHAALTHARPSVLVLQVLLGWKYGDSVDEKAKIHPQLRTYKSLTEKVANVESEIQKYWLRDAKMSAGRDPPSSLAASGEGDLQMAN